MTQSDLDILTNFIYAGKEAFCKRYYQEGDLKIALLSNDFYLKRVIDSPPLWIYDDQDNDVPKAFE